MSQRDTNDYPEPRLVATRVDGDIYIEAEVETGLAIDDPSSTTVFYRMGALFGQRMIDGLLNSREIPIDTTGRIVERPKALPGDDHANRG